MGQGSDPGRDPRPNADYLERQEVAFCIQGGGQNKQKRKWLRMGRGSMLHAKRSRCSWSSL